MNPATDIVAKFGGVASLATALRLPHSTVLRWTYPRAKGGTDGEIPRKRWRQLLALAEEKGVALSAADFFEAAA